MDPPAVDDYLSISNLGRRSKDAPAPAPNTPKSFPLGFRPCPCQGLLLLIRHSLFWFRPLSLQIKAQIPTPREVKSKQKTSAMAAPKGRSRRLDRAFRSIIIYTIMSFFVLVYLDLDGGGGGRKRVQNDHNRNKEDDLMEE
eukprot:scaffold6586_cov108-Skeletonema_marinoi.AAC.4